MEKQYRDSKGKPTTKKKYEEERLKVYNREVAMFKKELAAIRKNRFHDDGASEYKTIFDKWRKRPYAKGKVIKNKKDTQKTKVFTANEAWKLNNKKLNSLLSKTIKDIKTSKKKVGA